jgi:hypothetical protein
MKIYSKNAKGFIIECRPKPGGNVDDILLLSVILLMGLSIILLCMNLYTFKSTKNKKVLIVSGVFILFFIQGLLVFLSEIIDGLDIMQEVRTLLLIDVLVVLIIYAATVKSR